MTIENSVWIELPKPTSEENAQEICKLANRMLKRLCGDDMPGKFFYSTHDNCYHFRSGMTSKSLTDNGDWFNLDYFGRDNDE